MPYDELLESAILNNISNSKRKKSYFSVCSELKELCPETSKIIRKLIDFRRFGFIEEKIYDDNNLYLNLTEKGIEKLDTISKKIESQISMMKKYNTKNDSYSINHQENNKPETLNNDLHSKDNPKIKIKADNSSNNCFKDDNVRYEKKEENNEK